MKQLLLLAGMTAIAIPAFSQSPAEPKTIADSDAFAISPNACYLVSDGYSGMKIFNLSDGSSFDYTENSDYGKCFTGMANCVSDNGIVIGYDPNDGASFWMDSKWRRLKSHPQSNGSSMPNSITADGSRICGTVGMASMSYDDDVMRQAPCIWDWDAEKGNFSTPIRLPHPERDFSGRVPQLITAIDISQDGKTVVGQIISAAGWVKYPIIYTENEEGEWSYVIPDENALHPEGLEFPEYPGDEGPMIPSEESYMTDEEKAAYTEAYNEYVNSGYTLPEPQYKDFMTEEEIEAFAKAYDEFKTADEEWESKFYAWYRVYNEIADNVPNYEFNSIRLSPDGKKYANTIIVEDYIPAFDGFVGYAYIWVFDIESGAVTKYEQRDDFILTYLANEGIVLAASNLVDDPESYVLTGGECIDMQTYISGKVPEYGPWMDENMTQGIDVAIVDEETGGIDTMFVEKVITGRACGTPDMSVVALGVNNVWDLEDDGNSFIFDLKGSNGVSVIDQIEREMTIYDLNGRKLREAKTPGIYIINGQKKVVR